MFSQIFNCSGSLKLFTDGSKSDAGLSVGSACVCSELNAMHTRSIIFKASVYTAECMAISDALDIALNNNDRNINIFTDSLSVVQTLSCPKNKVDCNRYVLEIRNKYCRFLKNKTSNIDITIFWIPAHVGTTDNELADQQAKLATEQRPSINSIPYTDFKAMFKKSYANVTAKIILNQGSIKEQFSFQNYYQQSSKPWFLRQSLSREHIVTVCRCRSNH